MPTINNTTKRTQAQCRINQLTSSCGSQTVLSRTLIANQYGKDRISAYVDNPSQLPDIFVNGIPNGTLIFVNNLGVPVIASDFQWIGLDGRLLRSDIPPKQIWSWGCNSCGQLGDGTDISRSSPVSVVGGITDWCAIAAGDRHSVAIRTNGTAWSWGFNTSGQLGDGTLTNRSSPVSVIGGFTDWCAISAGTVHSVAVRTNGTAWAWGANFGGRLGDGTTIYRSSPVSVVGGFTDWSTIAAGDFHSLAIRTNGTAWSWGSNFAGRLGDGTVTNRSSPVSVIGGFADWCAIAAGDFHSLAIRTNGTAWSWGSNFAGRLGDGTTIYRSSPVSVVGGFTDWSTIDACGGHSLAIRANGTAWSWGINGSGQLGHNTATTCSRSSPVTVVGGFTDWCAIAAGINHSAAIRTNGTAWSWGLNTSGELGDGTVTNRSSPVTVVGGFTNWSAISAGGTHNLGLRVI